MIKFKLFLMAGITVFFMACSGNDSSADAVTGFSGDIAGMSEESFTAVDKGDVRGGEEFGEDDEGGVSDEDNTRKSGLLTAGEWNDLDNWKFWTDLLNENEFYEKTNYWNFFPNTLVAVKVIDEDSVGIANVSVKLLNGKKVEFATKTDNAGYAYCWIGMFGEATDDSTANYSLSVNEVEYTETLKVSGKKDQDLVINVITSDAKQADEAADIAFIVDATGSMGDEMEFLKSDLDYIIEHASSGNSIKLRTAALVYRDEEDEYITRHNDFSSDVSKTQNFLSKQEANGGGDYPEAVHTALESALQKLSWNESARSRIAFLVLDAPAHHTDKVIKNLQKSITSFAKNGIKIIPVAASGVDKDTEFMLRFFDLATGGTYVFLTNDSGIGGDHIKASVGDYKVEILADLMVRLIKKYVE